MERLARRGQGRAVGGERPGPQTRVRPGGTRTGCGSMASQSAARGALGSGLGGAAGAGDCARQSCACGAPLGEVSLRAAVGAERERALAWTRPGGVECAKGGSGTHQPSSGDSSSSNRKTGLTSIGLDADVGEASSAVWRCETASGDGTASTSGAAGSMGRQTQPKAGTRDPAWTEKAEARKVASARHVKRGSTTNM